MKIKAYVKEHTTPYIFDGVISFAVNGGVVLQVIYDNPPKDKPTSSSCFGIFTNIEVTQ